MMKNLCLYFGEAGSVSIDNTDIPLVVRHGLKECPLSNRRKHKEMSLNGVVGWTREVPATPEKWVVGGKLPWGSLFVDQACKFVSVDDVEIASAFGGRHQSSINAFLNIDLISDANPTVVANAVSALSEIGENSGKDVMMVTANYSPQDAREAEGIIERVSPRLQHANSAVVMSAVKVILRYMDDVSNQEVIRTVSKKLAPPLEAVVVIKDIFRKYPNKYESIIATLCENLEDLDEPEAKASMVWIIGEYAERIDNADELLESFLESFQDETALVQLQLLTATVKLFLKQPDNTQEMVQKVLNLATEHSDNPDLRDRGYVYWRLLSSDPEAARAVVLSQKPEIGDDTFTIEPALLEELVSQIGTLASIYHKPPEAFVMKSTQVPLVEDEDEEVDEEAVDDEAASHSGKSSVKVSGSQSTGGDLLDLMDDISEPIPSFSSQQSVPKVEILSVDAGHGISISAVMIKKSGQVSKLVAAWKGLDETYESAVVVN
eukprot:gene22255-28368_t